MNQKQNNLSIRWRIHPGLAGLLLVASLLSACSTAPTTAQPTATQAPSIEVPTATALPPAETLPPPTDVPPTPTSQPEPTAVSPTPEVPPLQDESVGNGIALPLPAPKEGKPGLVASTNVNVRTGPGTDYASYGVLLEGESAQVTGVSPDGVWWVVNYPQGALGQGWISAEFSVASNTQEVPTVTPPPVPPTLVFTSAPAADIPQARLSDSIYVRSGPGFEYPVYGVIPAMKTVPIVYRNRVGDWLAVYINSNLIPTRHAWVPAAYLRTKNARYTPGTPSHPMPATISLPAPAEGAPAAYPMAPQYLRSGPGQEYPVLGVVGMDTAGEITGVSPNGEWWQVRVPGKVSLDGLAWVPAAFIIPANTAEVPVVEPPAAPTLIKSVEPSAGDPSILTLETVNFFAGPGNEYPVLGVLPGNTKAIVRGISRDGDWYIIRIPLAVDSGGQAWIKAEFVEAEILRSLPIVEPPAK